MPAFQIERVYAALFALATALRAPGALDGPPDGNVGPNGEQAAAGTPSASQPFNLVTREIIEMQRVPPSLQPALMMLEWNEIFGDSGDGLVPERLQVLLLIGCTTKRGELSQPKLNALVDTVIAALAAPVGEDLQTLGGLVYRLQPKGAAAKDHGENSNKEDRQALYVLPLEIIISRS